MEIERKFKVLNNLYKYNNQGIYYVQGYLSTTPERTVRIRVIDKKAFLTVKGLNEGIVRSEFEYEIPSDDALYMLNNLCEKPIIEKFRYKYMYEDFIWEIDEFLGDNKGLVIAEIELEYKEQKFKIPSWIGEEVTGDIRYYNSNLIKNPYKNW